jgi:hypothetical protein
MHKHQACTHISSQYQIWQLQKRRERCSYILVASAEHGISSQCKADSTCGVIHWTGTAGRPMAVNSGLSHSQISSGNVNSICMRINAEMLSHDVVHTSVTLDCSKPFPKHSRGIRQTPHAPQADEAYCHTYNTTCALAMSHPESQPSPRSPTLVQTSLHQPGCPSAQAQQISVHPANAPCNNNIIADRSCCQHALCMRDIRKTYK